MRFRICACSAQGSSAANARRPIATPAITAMAFRRVQDCIRPDGTRSQVETAGYETWLAVIIGSTLMLTLEKFSIGVGDRFAHQARAQLCACMKAAERGVTVIPVWNKSNREHLIVGSEPNSVRA